MSRSVFGFYELDAAPQHGLQGELATRLGAATAVEGFVDGSLYVRSDHAAVAIEMQSGDVDGWEDEGSVATLLYSADWRSRTRDVASYRLAGTIAGDGDPLGDSSFFVIQRFEVKPDVQERFVKAIADYAQTYAANISGFLRGSVFAGLAGTRVVFVTAWAHEAALNALENRDGSLPAMQQYLRLAERRSFESYERISYLRKPHS